MKTKFLVYASVFLIAILFTACSNDSEEYFSESVTGNQLVSESLQSIEEEPYISPGMQALIDRLDTATVPLPIEKLIPGIGVLLVEDTTSLKQNIVTRSASSVVVKGYNSKKFLFQNKMVTLNAYDSPFKSSLNCTWTVNATYYMSAIAIWKNIQFENAVSYFSAEANDGDFTGIAPDSFNTDEISNDTYFTLGFSSEEKYAGYDYRLTTYIIVLSTSSSFYGGYLFPYHGKYSDKYDMSIDGYCESLEWRYFSVQ